MPTRRSAGFLLLLLLCIIVVVVSADHYQTLGVSRSATQDQIKNAYKKLALKWHPDRNKNNKDAEKKFIEINNAYEILRDPEKRKQYDRFGSVDENDFSAGQRSGGGSGGGSGNGGFTWTFTTSGGGGGFSDPFDIFEEIFGTLHGDFHFNFGGHQWHHDGDEVTIEEVDDYDDDDDEYDINFASFFTQRKRKTDTNKKKAERKSKQQKKMDPIRESPTQLLSKEEYRQLVENRHPQSHQQWLVFLYAHKCAMCRKVAPLFNAAAESMRGRIRFARFEVTDMAQIPQTLYQRSTSLPLLIGVRQSDFSQFKATYYTKDTILQYAHDLLLQDAGANQQYIEFNEDEVDGRGGVYVLQSLSRVHRFVKSAQLTSDRVARLVADISSNASASIPDSPIRTRTVFFSTLGDPSSIEKEFAWVYRDFTSVAHVFINSSDHWALDTFKLKLRQLPAICFFRPFDKPAWHFNVDPKLIYSLFEQNAFGILPILASPEMLADYCMPVISESTRPQNEQTVYCFIYIHPPYSQPTDSLSERINLLERLARHTKEWTAEEAAKANKKKRNSSERRLKRIYRLAQIVTSSDAEFESFRRFLKITNRDNTNNGKGILMATHFSEKSFAVYDQNKPFVSQPIKLWMKSISLNKDKLRKIIGVFPLEKKASVSKLLVRMIKRIYRYAAQLPHSWLAVQFAAAGKKLTRLCTAAWSAVIGGDRNHTNSSDDVYIIDSSTAIVSIAVSILTFMYVVFWRRR